MKNSKTLVLSAVLAMFLLLTSCISLSKKDHSKKFPDKLFLKAKGLGQSEPEARNNALSELTKIFEARIVSEMKDKVSSTIEDGNETYMQSIESDIKIASDVELTGAEIKDEWYDEKKKTYYALAVLNKKIASNNWAKRIDSIDEKMDAEQTALNSKTFYLEKFKLVKNIIKLWVEKSTYSERIRVLGINYSGSNSVNMGNIFKQLSKIRSKLIIHIKGQGNLLPDLKSAIQKTLTKKGLIFSNDQAKSNVVIECKVIEDQLDIKNPGWIYARVAVSVKVLDLESKNIVGEFTKDKRSAKTSYNEAKKSALKIIIPKLEKELISFFE